MSNSLHRSNPPLTAAELHRLRAELLRVAATLWDLRPFLDRMVSRLPAPTPPADTFPNVQDIRPPSTARDLSNALANLTADHLQPAAEALEAAARASIGGAA